MGICDLKSEVIQELKVSKLLNGLPAMEVLGEGRRTLVSWQGHYISLCPGIWLYTPSSDS